MDISEARQVLSTRGWLAMTPPGFRDAVLARCELHSFAAGETVYAQGDGPSGMWGLAEGTVGIELSGQSRDAVYAYLAGKGFWIGAHPLVLGTERQVGLVALRPSSLLNLPSTTFHAMARQDPEAWRWLAVLPLLQTSLAFGVLEDLAIRDTPRRCAAMLLRLAGCRGPTPSQEADEIFVTQEHLAEMINLSRTALGVVLRAFESQRLIERQYGKVKIDRERLEVLLNSK